MSWSAQMSYLILHASSMLYVLSVLFSYVPSLKCIMMVDVGCICLFKQKTAYELRISDWSSDVCSSDLAGGRQHAGSGRYPGDRGDQHGARDAYRRPLFSTGLAVPPQHRRNRSAAVTRPTRGRARIARTFPDPLRQALRPAGARDPIGRASSRERLGTYV